MKFDLFLEKVDTNGMSKNTSVGTFVPEDVFSARTVKDAHNKLVKFIWSSPKINKDYILIKGEGDWSGEMFYIVNRSSIEKKLTDIANKYRGKKDAKLDGYFMETEMVFGSKEVKAGSVDFESTTFKGKKVHIVGEAGVSRFHQGKGIMGDAYKYLILEKGYTLASNSQSPGARKMWANMARDPKIQVMAFDSGKGTVLPLEVHGDKFFMTVTLHYDPKSDFNPDYILAKKA